MFIDAKTVPDGTELTGDVCIVGAGAAGITMAREFAGRGLKILLIESGGFDYSEATQELYDGKIGGLPFTPLYMDRLRYFGGTTNHWSGGCSPLSAEALAGWPFGRKELDPFYSRAQQVCQIGPFAYTPEDWQTGDTRPFSFAADAPIQTGVFQYSPPTRFGKVYRADLAKATDVAVYLDTNLLDIEVDEHASTVTGLRLARLDGARLQARAKYYVLAAGGIENPRLLLNANKVQAVGLGNGADLVGRYFMDHPDVSGAATIVFDKPDAALAFYSPHKVRGQAVQGYFFASPETQKQENLPEFAIGITPGNRPDKELAKQSLAEIYRNITSGRLPNHLGYHVSRIMDGVIWEAEDIYARVLDRTPKFFSTVYTCGAAPQRDSRVKLIDQVDALGMRRVELDWHLPADFASSLRRAHELLAQALGRSGLGRLRLEATDDAAVMKKLENAHHHLGTTRMHQDPRQGVVDANCKIHGVHNLFIAGSSVFPTYGFDNPTLTIVALALRLSDHLKTLIA